jgi:hypothetical protein
MNFAALTAEYQRKFSALEIRRNLNEIGEFSEARHRPPLC